MMSHEEKINYMRIAANICRFGFDYEHLDKLVWIYETVRDLGGETTLKDITDIEFKCKEAFKKRIENEVKNEP